MFENVTWIRRSSFRVKGSNSTVDAPCLEIEFEKYGCMVSYPSSEEIEERAKALTSNIPVLEIYSEVV